MRDQSICDCKCAPTRSRTERGSISATQRRARGGSAPFSRAIGDRRLALASSFPVSARIRVAKPLEHFGQEMPPSVISPNTISTHHYERGIRRDVSAKFANASSMAE